MSGEPPWPVTTHDWSLEVDRKHLWLVRDAPSTFAPTGVLHLVFEVVAYAADEADDRGVTAACTVCHHDDGSVSITDKGRGTDTRISADGSPVRKPVVSTPDLRFFRPG